MKALANRSAKGLVAPVRRCLGEGPAIVQEIAEELGRSVDDVTLAMWCLTHTGQAKSARTVEVDPGGFRGRRHLKLYELTPHGRYRLKRDGP